MIQADIGPALEMDFTKVVREKFAGDAAAALQQAVQEFVDRVQSESVPWEQRFDALLRRIDARARRMPPPSESEIDRAIRCVRGPQYSLQ